MTPSDATADILPTINLDDLTPEYLAIWREAYTRGFMDELSHVSAQWVMSPSYALEQHGVDIFVRNAVKIANAVVAGLMRLLETATVMVNEEPEPTAEKECAL